jgi:hypothetical protein
MTKVSSWVLPILPVVTDMDSVIVGFMDCDAM